MDKPLATQLLEEIERFLAVSGMAPSTFGATVTGNRNLVQRLREGTQPRTDTVDSVRRFIREWRPEQGCAA